MSQEIWKISQSVIRKNTKFLDKSHERGKKKKKIHQLSEEKYCRISPLVAVKKLQNLMIWLEEKKRKIRQLIEKKI